MPARRILEFNFNQNTVAVTYDTGEIEIGTFRRLANGDVLLAGQKIGHAADENEVQLVVREWFVR